jgi:hypothetical protein
MTNDQCPMSNDQCLMPNDHQMIRQLAEMTMNDLPYEKPV